MNTIDISPINHSYWSYVYQLSYRTGAPPCSYKLPFTEDFAIGRVVKLPEGKRAMKVRAICWGDNMSSNGVSWRLSRCTPKPLTPRCLPLEGVVVDPPFFAGQPLKQVNLKKTWVWKKLTHAHMFNHSFEVLWWLKYVYYIYNYWYDIPVYVCDCRLMKS